MIDTHCHVNFNAFISDADEVIKRTLEKGVEIINVGSQYSTSRRAVEYAEKYQKGVYAAVALHPIHLEDASYDASEGEDDAASFRARAEEFDYAKFKELAENEKVVAIGETGIDYFHTTPIKDRTIEEIKEKQIRVFEEHIKLAKETGKPLIIHCREAHGDVLEILKKYFQNQNRGPYRGPYRVLYGVIHFFSGTMEEAKEYLNLGFLLSFTGVITFHDRKGNYVGNYAEVIKEIPLEKIMAETDSPYVAPEPMRGKRNEPLYVKYVIRRIAEIKEISFEEAVRQTTENARKLFKLD